MSDDKMPDVIYIDRCERSMVGTLTGRFGTIKVDGDTTYYSESHVQHLIDQAKAEQREACHKAVLVAASYGIDGDVDDIIGVGNASEAILNATEDK